MPGQQGYERPIPSCHATQIITKLKIKIKTKVGIRFGRKILDNVLER